MIVLWSAFPFPGRRMECVVSMQPQPWPQPAQEIATAVRAAYAGREVPLPVRVRDQLRELFAVQVLRTVLLQNYTRTITKDRREVVGRREADSDGLPQGRSRLTSPYDTDARWGVKRDEFWNGYKVHLSETCTAPGAGDTAGPAAPGAKPGQVPDRPNLITNVATTDATVPDAKMADKIHQSLAARNLLPAEHYLDSGYPSAELIVGARATYGIALITPVLLDTSVQARGNAGFQAAAFTID